MTADSWTGNGAGAGRQLAELSAEPVIVQLSGYRLEINTWGYLPPVPWRNTPHVHSCYEVCYAYAGEGLFRANGADHAVTAGDVFVARPGDPHEIVAEGVDPLGLCFWSFSLRGEGPQPAVDDGGRELWAAFAAGTPPIARDSGRVPALLDLLAREAGSTAPGRQELVAGLAAALLVAAARTLVGDRLAAPRPELLATLRTRAGSRELATARQIVRYLHDNYDRPVQIRDVSAQVHLSERHVSRIFAQATGQTIHGYLQRLRLEIAAEHLADRALPVKEVARRTGYPDVRNFTTAFRRRYQITPAAFRAARATRHLTPEGTS